MKLYLISQTENNDYDTYDSAVVSAEDEKTARQMSPRNGKTVDWKDVYNAWCNAPEKVTVKYLGEAEQDKRMVVCASFNAG